MTTPITCVILFLLQSIADCIESAPILVFTAVRYELALRKTWVNDTVRCMVTTIV